MRYFIFLILLIILSGCAVEEMHRETPQEKEWHPEGDVWVHTLMTVDRASELAHKNNLESDKALTLLLASLCHDLGKPMVTEYVDGRIKSIGHEPAGEEPTKKFLASIGTDNQTRNKVVKLVTNHLIPSMFYIEHQIKEVVEGVSEAEVNLLPHFETGQAIFSGVGIRQPVIVKGKSF